MVEDLGSGRGGRESNPSPATTKKLMSAVANIIESVRHLEYDKKYKWLNCSDCGELTSPERFMPHEEKCLMCSQKEEVFSSKTHQANLIIERGCDNFQEFLKKASGIGLSTDELKEVWEDYWYDHNVCQEGDRVMA